MGRMILVPTAFLPYSYRYRNKFLHLPPMFFRARSANGSAATYVPYSMLLRCTRRWSAPKAWGIRLMK